MASAAIAKMPKGASLTTKEAIRPRAASRTASPDSRLPFSGVAITARPTAMAKTTTAGTAVSDSARKTLAGMNCATKSNWAGSAVSELL